MDWKKVPERPVPPRNDGGIDGERENICCLIPVKALIWDVRNRNLRSFRRPDDEVVVAACQRQFVECIGYVELRELRRRCGGKPCGQRVGSKQSGIHDRGATKPKASWVPDAPSRQVEKKISIGPGPPGGPM